MFAFSDHGLRVAPTRDHNFIHLVRILRLSGVAEDDVRVVAGRDTKGQKVETSCAAEELVIIFIGRGGSETAPIAGKLPN